MGATVSIMMTGYHVMNTGNSCLKEVFRVGRLKRREKMVDVEFGCLE